jgi:hypothetical protein
MALTYGVIILVAATLMLFFSFSTLKPMNYLLIAITCSLLGSYYSLLSRISNWSTIMQAVMVCIMGPGVAAGLLQDWMPIPLLALIIAAVAILFRWLACVRFQKIDWYRVKPHVQQTVS